MDKGFTLRRIIVLIGLELFLYWGLDYKIDYVFWIASLCFLTITIVSILCHEISVVEQDKPVVEDGK